MSHDLYSVLEVPKGADSSEIRKQYLKLSRIYHPDKVEPEKQAEATEKFKEISKAYEILSDNEKRTFYDQTGQLPGENGGGGGGGGFPFPMGGGMPFPMGGGGMHFNMNDLFGMFGGGRGGGGPAVNVRRPGKAPDRKTQIPLTLKDFYYGRTLQIHLDRNRFCGGCNGDGCINKKDCSDCNGTGTKVNIVQMGPMIMQNTGPCLKCSGSGKTKGDACGQCNGSKFIKQDKKLELVVTKGMKSGDIVRFAGESSHVEDYTEPGDVLVELVEADEDHGWERLGDVLKNRVSLTLGEALCGKVVRLNGHPAHEEGVFIQIPAGVQNRQEIIIEGLGMPRVIGSGYGEVVIVLTIMPTKEERAVLETNTDHLRTLFSASAGETSAPLVWSAKPIVY
jgi:DnaJ-class molecular chaperone